MACTPQGWTKGTLTIDCDGVRINYTLKNDAQPGLAPIGYNLRDLIDELYVKMANQGDKWAQATLSFFEERNNRKFKLQFHVCISRRAERKRSQPYRLNGH